LDFRSNCSNLDHASTHTSTQPVIKPSVFRGVAETYLEAPNHHVVQGMLLKIVIVARLYRLKVHLALNVN